MVVRKSFKGTGGLESDRVVVKDLSPNLLAVIGGVMAQSVALVRMIIVLFIFSVTSERLLNCWGLYSVFSSFPCAMIYSVSISYCTTYTY